MTKLYIEVSARPRWFFRAIGGFDSLVGAVIASFLFETLKLPIGALVKCNISELKVSHD